MSSVRRDQRKVILLVFELSGLSHSLGQGWNSAAHKQIVSHTRGVKGATAVVKLYDLVN
jgi:hypothetical protein